MWRLFLFRFSTKFRKRTSVAIHSAMALVILGSLIMPLISFSPKAQAASAGPRYATASGDCVNQTGVGTVAWTNPGNAFSSNNSNATASLGTATTNYLKCTNFGFTLPYSAINGITVSFERDASADNRIYDSAVRIVKGGTIGTTDKSGAAAWIKGETTVNYGSTSDTWGETWASTDINATNFGAAIAATRSAGGSSTASVDSIAITVQYTP